MGFFFCTRPSWLQGTNNTFRNNLWAGWTIYNRGYWLFIINMKTFRLLDYFKRWTDTLFVFFHPFHFFPLCTFPLAPQRQSLLHQKGLREANVEWWEQKKQLPQNWGHSNGENKIQDKKQMKLHAKEGDNEYLQNTNMKSYWYSNGKGKELKMLDFQLLSSLSFLAVQAFSHSNCSCWHLETFLIMKMKSSILHLYALLRRHVMLETETLTSAL